MIPECIYFHLKDRIMFFDPDIMASLPQPLMFFDPVVEAGKVSALQDMK